MCFPRKLQKFVIFLGRIQEISALVVNICCFQQILGKYLPCPDQHWFNEQKFGLKQGVQLFQYRRCKNSHKIEGKVE